MTRQRYKFSDEINRQIEALYALDNWHGVVSLLMDYCVIAASIFCTLYFGWLLYPLAIAVIASRQRALATIQHEAAHFTLSKNKTLNYLLGSVFSGHLIFQNFSTYIQSHVRNHHGYIGDEKLDPDYNYHISLGLYEKQKKENRLVCGLKFLASYWSYLVRYRIANFKSKDVTSHLNLWLNIATVLSFIYFGWLHYYLIFWLVPMFTFYLMIGWYIEVSEHYPLVGENTIDLYMSRNRFGSVLENFFFSIHNENYHLTHHLKVRIPFWHLERAHQILMQDENYKRLHRITGGVFTPADTVAQWALQAQMDCCSVLPSRGNRRPQITQKIREVSQ